MDSSAAGSAKHSRRIRASGSFSRAVISRRPRPWRTGSASARSTLASLDSTDPDLALRLRKLGVSTLIHTAGPFQGQGYEVARAAIKAGCSYLDLADGRAFVSGITKLDAEARAAGVAVISGASSLPALSAAVVDRYRGEFSRLDAIRIGITSGGVIPGVANVARHPGLLRKAVSHAGERRVDRRAGLARYAGGRFPASRWEQRRIGRLRRPLISSCCRLVTPA
jgi:hypothetical protein